MHTHSIMYVYMYFLRKYNHEFEREQGGAWDMLEREKRRKMMKLHFNFIK